MATAPASVLIIDDSEENRVLLTSRLMRNGYRVTSASAGKEGLDLVAANAFDLILLDIIMPGLGGMEVLKAIRKLHPAARLPIIMLTAQRDSDVAVEALRLGANDYVSMPTDLQILLARVALHIRTKQAEEAVLEAHAGLERRVEERTHELQQKNHKLSKLYRTAHQFVDNVSHEFRTPLTVIKEFASILNDGIAGDLNKEQLEFIRIILTRADDLSLMVDDMLDMSRLEADLLCVRRTVHSVVDIVERMRTVLERKAASSGVKMTICLPDDLPAVYCDAENIGRVIINLVVNACKFSTDDCEVSLWARHDRDTAQVTLGVTDNGRGIAADHVKAIFRRFKQVGSEVTGSGKGFGLGLNIAKELVHLNFGEVSVESEPGKGSIFAFTIPTYEHAPILDRFVARIEQTDACSPFVSLFCVHIDPRTASAECEKVDGFLHHNTRRHDLIFRPSPHAWLACVAASHTQLEEMKERIADTRAESNRNRPDGQLPILHINHGRTWGLEDSDAFKSGFLAEWVAAEAGAGPIGQTRSTSDRADAARTA